MMKLFACSLRIALKKMFAYPNEIIMIFFHSLFQLLSTILFWVVLFDNVDSFGYDKSFIYLLAMVGMLSSAIEEMFFGLRDFEWLVRDGSLDRYLYRPQNTLFMIMIENIPLVAFVEQLVLGIVGIILVVVKFDIAISFVAVLKMIILLIIGNVYYQTIYATITMLSLRFEKISTLRDLIFNFNFSKNYPTTIFPNFLRKFLTYVVPVSLIAFVPTLALSGKPTRHFPLILIFLAVSLMVLYIVYNRGLRRYSSNGG